MSDITPAVAEQSLEDQAARAAWLYYVGQKTQDQIAQELGISRQRAQRLVARAVADGLIQFRLDHRIARCLELENEFLRRGRRRARIAPNLDGGAFSSRAIAPIAAAEIECALCAPEPIVIAVGTGRALRAAVEQVHSIDYSQHKLVSLNGNISPDGSASNYDVLMRLADRVNATHYPMPVPVVAASIEERELLHSLTPIRRSIAMARMANVAFVGIGHTSDTAPMLRDGFLTPAEFDQVRRAGAAGEIVGWFYDDSGKYLDIDINRRMAGICVEPPGDSDRLVIGVAAGPEKYRALRAASDGGLINGLITDEETALALLD